MRFARDPVAAVTPVVGRVRGDEPITASTAIAHVHPQRDARPACSGISTPLMEGIAARGVGEHFHVYILSDTRRPGDRAAEEDRAFAALAANVARTGSPSPIAAAPQNTGFKAGNVRDFCERWGADHEFAAHARRRQRDDGGRGAAAGARHADRSAHRHPAEPGHRHAVGQRLRAHLPVRHAARHALLHARRRLVAGRLRTLLGPQRARAHCAFHGSTVICRSSPTARWSAAMCSATTRSKRC